MTYIKLAEECRTVLKTLSVAWGFLNEQFHEGYGKELRNVPAVLSQYRTVILKGFLASPSSHSHPCACLESFIRNFLKLGLEFLESQLQEMAVTDAKQE